MATAAAAATAQALGPWGAAAETTRIVPPTPAAASAMPTLVDQSTKRPEGPLWLSTIVTLSSPGRSRGVATASAPTLADAAASSRGDPASRNGGDAGAPSPRPALMLPSAPKDARPRGGHPGGCTSAAGEGGGGGMPGGGAPGPKWVPLAPPPAESARGTLPPALLSEDLFPPAPLLAPGGGAGAAGAASRDA